MGGFNDQATVPALASFHASTLAFQFLRGHRGEAYTASCAFNGIRSAIDHFVFGGAGVSNPSLTYFNLNADALWQVSDHNPVVLLLE